MKKKILISMIITLLMTLVMFTIFFEILENYEYLENSKQTLKINNELIINVIKNEQIKNKQAFFSDNFKNEVIRETLIDKSGKVLSDTVTDSETMDNHNGRKEINDARKYGKGYTIRYSDTTRANTLYYATSFGEGYIVRSAITMQTIKGVEMRYFKYYFLALSFSIAVSFLFARKISYSILKPLKDLEFITSRIAKGELHRRANVTTKDEIGHLGKTFNNMADKLQDTLNDQIDKQNKLEAILKSMDSGVIAVDKNNKVIMINPYAKKIFSLKKDIIGQNLIDNIRDFEFEDIFKNTDEAYREIKILWPKERELRIRTAEIINGEEKIGVVAVVQDITDIKKLENMRSQFVANVSHELKTPLTSIKGFAETLRYVEDPVNKDKFLNIINDEADRLTRLINDILILSHIENNLEGKSEGFDVSNIVKDVCYLMKNSVEEKKITLLLNEEPIPKLFGDSDRFKQMLINLVDNSIKYTEMGGMVKVSTKAEQDKCFIIIEDTGIGIPEEHLGRIFERFYRVDKARSRTQGGTGLGLAIVKHIVMSFNGTISVESEVGKGSKFIVEFPLGI